MNLAALSLNPKTIEMRRMSRRSVLYSFENMKNGILMSGPDYCEDFLVRMRMHDGI